MPTTCEYCGKEHATKEELEEQEANALQPKKPKVKKAWKQEPYGDII
jgi:hypothetical protein